MDRGYLSKRGFGATGADFSPEAVAIAPRLAGRGVGKYRTTPLGTALFFSSGAMLAFNPPIVACGISPAHHTAAGISAHGAFSLNLPGTDLVEATDWCGMHSGKRTDKSAVFETFTGSLENAPMIRRCRLAAECRLLQTVSFPVDTVYFGEVTGIHVDESVLVDGAPDWRRLDPLLFTFPDKGYRKLGEYVAEAWSVGKRFRR